MDNAKEDSSGLPEASQPGYVLRPDQIDLYIRDLEKVIFEGPAKAVSAFNGVGLFDVLPLHENFISIIQEKIIIRLTDESKQELNIERGVIKAIENKIYIFLGV